MNADIISIFQKHCDTLVVSLTGDTVNNLKNTNDDFERIKYLYSHAKSVAIPISRTNKSYEDAVIHKTNGNTFYEKKILDKALENYSTAIIVCPQDTSKGKELVAITIANRSAVLFEKELQQQCLDDINYLIHLGTYPKHLQHKILVRKGKCCLNLGKHADGIAALKQAICNLKKSNVSPANLKTKLTEINTMLDQLKIQSDDANLQLVPSQKISITTFSPNSKYPAVNDFVDFDEDSSQGRFAKAKRDIEPGSIIAEEEPYCWAISITSCTQNCSNCAKSTVNPIPCALCRYATYCSKECSEEAEYHKIECKITHSLYESGASVNCIMALRIITQKKFLFFWNERNTWSNPILPGNLYKGSDYRRLYHLCTHSSMRPIEEFIHYSFMAIYLLRLLKLTNYFPYDTKDDILTEEECFIGGLILRHLQILQFNAHELSELRNMKTVNENELNYYTCHLGGGVYPTLALFNHSCEPGIIRYNKERKMVLRAIKLIKAGEIIYDNYGPIYSAEDRISRLRSLRERYWFECHCIACFDDWPLFNDMSDCELRLLCRKCKSTNVVSKFTETPIFNCVICGSINNILTVLMQLKKLDRMTQDAEKSFMMGNFQKCVVLYCEILKLYFKYLAPPFPDLVKVQQRIRTCMLHDGNKEFHYMPPKKLTD